MLQLQVEAPSAKDTGGNGGSVAAAIRKTLSAPTMLTPLVSIAHVNNSVRGQCWVPPVAQLQRQLPAAPGAAPSVGSRPGTGEGGDAGSRPGTGTGTGVCAASGGDVLGGAGPCAAAAVGGGAGAAAAAAASAVARTGSGGGRPRRNEAGSRRGHCAAIAAAAVITSDQHHSSLCSIGSDTGTTRQDPLFQVSGGGLRPNSRVQSRHGARASPPPAQPRSRGGVGAGGGWGGLQLPIASAGGQRTAPLRSQSPLVTRPSSRTCSIDGDTEVPEDLFNDLLRRGEEVRSGGQHVLQRSGASGGRLVHHDLQHPPFRGRSKTSLSGSDRTIGAKAAVARLP